MKRSLRISGLKDYFAVDLVDNEDKIIKTPFYIIPGEEKHVMVKDQENGKKIKTSVRISSDFTHLICIDSEKFEWEEPFEGFLEPDYIFFIPVN